MTTLSTRDVGRSAAGSPTPLRRQLRATRDAIAAAKIQHSELRATQFKELGAAAANGAKTKEAVAAAGLSRAYLHKAEGGPTFRGRSQQPTAESAAAREAALHQVSQLRDRIAKVQEGLDAGAGKRVHLVRKLLELDVDQATIAEDAGVSAEWIRRLAKAR